MSDILPNFDIQSSERFHSESDVVSSAAKKAISTYFEKNIPVYRRSIVIDAPKKLEELTFGACLKISGRTAHILESESPENWNRVFILSSDEPPDGGFYSQPKPHLEGKTWRWHSYCIAESKSGDWYAISPANLSIKPDRELISKPLKGPSLKEVINQIQASEGGIWGDPAEIVGAYERYRRMDYEEEKKRYSAYGPIVCQIEVGNDLTRSGGYLVRGWEPRAPRRVGAKRLIKYLIQEVD